MARRYLPLSVVERWLPAMRASGVSRVARGPGGFLAAYRRAGGDPGRLSEAWRAKREAFLDRHLAQVRARGESLWRGGEPTRRHLALVAWAYSPQAARLERRPNPVDPRDVPDAIHAELSDAVDRAVAVGADEDRLEYVGAGAEGIVFRDGARAYKVGRRDLRWEAAAAEALDDVGAPVPVFAAYHPRENVLVREFVEGRPGRWADESRLWDLWRSEVVPVLLDAELTKGEFKADSFVVRPDGSALMVDVGYVFPTGRRAARDVERRIEALRPGDDVAELVSDARLVLADGVVGRRRALEWADALAGAAPGDVPAIAELRRSALRANPRGDRDTDRDKDDELARAVLLAAEKTPKKFGERLAFIDGVLDSFPRSRGRVRARLVDLHRAGLVELARADLVGAMDPALAADSEVTRGPATFHFVRLPRERRR